MNAIVMCRYNEDDSLVKELCENTEATVYVYDKGPSPITYKHDRLNHIIMENIGREGYVYLNHMINYYDVQYDKILFTQAKVKDHTDRHNKNENTLYEFFNQTEKTNYKSYITELYSCDMHGNPHHGGLNLNTVWNIFMKNEIPHTINFHPAAIFITNSDTIKKYTIEQYKNCIKTLLNDETLIYWDKVANIHEFSLERLWSYILTL